MTPEGKVKAWAEGHIRQYLPGCRFFRVPGGPFGRAGEPDIQVVYGGCFGVIEAKVKDADPTPLQWKRLREYAAAGALAMVLRGKDDKKLAFFCKLLKERAECLKHIIGQQSQG